MWFCSLDGVAEVGVECYVFPAESFGVLHDTLSWPYPMEEVGDSDPYSGKWRAQDCCVFGESMGGNDSLEQELFSVRASDVNKHWATVFRVDSQWEVLCSLWTCEKCWHKLEMIAKISSLIGHFICWDQLWGLGKDGVFFDHGYEMWCVEAIYLPVPRISVHWYFVIHIILLAF